MTGLNLSMRRASLIATPLLKPTVTGLRLLGSYYHSLHPFLLNYPCVLKEAVAKALAFRQPRTAQRRAARNNDHQSLFL